MTLEYMLVTEPIFWQIMALVAVLLGVGFILVGMRMSRRTTPSRSQTALLLRQIRRMAYGDDAHVYDADDLQAVWHQWRGQMGIAAIAAGAGVLVGVLISFALAQLALHAPFSLPVALFWLLCLPSLWGITFGFAFGSIIAAQRQAASRRVDATTADLPISHKISDYRSHLLTIIVAIPAVVYTALTILVAPKYRVFDAFDLQEYLAIHGHALILPTQWILAIYPGAMWLSVLIVELCVWARVKTPASITSPNLRLARGASMALIGRKLAFIYAPMIVSLGQIVGIGVTILLLPTMHALHLDTLILVTCGCTMLVGLFSWIMLVTPSEGRLGGRLTGWAWTKERTQGVVSAEAEG